MSHEVFGTVPANKMGPSSIVEGEQKHVQHVKTTAPEVMRTEAVEARHEMINHPAHYGGADNVYEHIKVADAWGLNYRLGNATKYICRAGKKPGTESLQDLRKALWYLQSEIERIESV